MQDKNLPLPVKDKFPRIIFVIILTEFCERFSYSGMRAFLTLYLSSKLGYTDDEATEIYHIFSTFVYLFPIFGGILADNYLGKFRTILYLMFVYAAGNLLVAVTAVPQLQLPGRLCTTIGLFMITVGTGGIKPCVTAFGGDQFKLPEQEKYLAIYFSVLYFCVCSGSLIAKTVSPILRSEVQCFGDKDCYSLAFGAPGFIILASMVIFVAAKSRYVMKNPSGNVVFDFVNCVYVGIKNKILKRGLPKKHWLDTVENYDKAFKEDVKKALSIFVLFSVTPVFWALLDQLGSRWTLQASRMSGSFGFITIKPDQMQVLSPIIILIVIPLSQKCIYPYLEKRNILKNPLHKLSLGMFLAGAAFIASALVEIYLKTTYPVLPTPGLSQLRMFNGNACPIKVTSQIENIAVEIPPLQHFSKKDIKTENTTSITAEFQSTCVNIKEYSVELEENVALSYYVYGNKVYRYRDVVGKSKSGLPLVRFLVSEEYSYENITLYNVYRGEVEALIYPGISHLHEIFASKYSILVDGNPILNNVEMASGGVYTVMLYKNKENHSYNCSLVEVTSPNSISMAWLFPQFVMIATGEVLFAVTGNEFAFKESPESMKAVMTAMWLLSDAVGNVIIIIVTRLFAGYQQETQSLIYTGMMFVSMVAFIYLSRRYTNRREHEETQRYGDVRKKSKNNSDIICYSQVKETQRYGDVRKKSKNNSDIICYSQVKQEVDLS